MRPAVPRPQDRLPYRWRLAAEWQFGMGFLMALAALLRGDFASAGATVLFSALMFMMLAGFRRDRTITSPFFWWLVVSLITGMFAFGVVILIFNPPEG